MAENRNYALIGRMIAFNRTHRRAIETVVDNIGMTGSRHRLLMNLAKQDKFSSQKEIAEHMGISQAAVTTSLSRLERDGLIGRTAGSDGRFNEIFITDKGRKIVEKTRDHFFAIDNICFSGFSDAELDSLQSMLDRMLGNITGFVEEKQQ